MNDDYLVFRVSITPQRQVYNGLQAIALKKENRERLAAFLTGIPDVRVIGDFGNKADIHVFSAEKLQPDERTWAEHIFEKLKSCDFLEAIEVYVNDDLSEKIAINHCDYVPAPWNKSYSGYNDYTLIFHK